MTRISEEEIALINEYERKLKPYKNNIPLEYKFLHEGNFYLLQIPKGIYMTEKMINLKRAFAASARDPEESKNTLAFASALRALIEKQLAKDSDAKPSALLKGEDNAAERLYKVIPRAKL